MTNVPEVCSTLNDVFWSYVGMGHRDIDCRGFIRLCRESNLLAEADFDGNVTEVVFVQSMLVARRRLDFQRLELALRRVAEIKGMEEKCVLQLILDAHRHMQKEGHSRSTSQPAAVPRPPEARPDASRPHARCRERSRGAPSKACRRNLASELKDYAARQASQQDASQGHGSNFAVACAQQDDELPVSYARDSSSFTSSCPVDDLPVLLGRHKRPVNLVKDALGEDENCASKTTAGTQQKPSSPRTATISMHQEPSPPTSVIALTLVNSLWADNRIATASLHC